MSGVCGDCRNSCFNAIERTFLDRMEEACSKMEKKYIRSGVIVKYMYLKSLGPLSGKIGVEFKDGYRVNRGIEDKIIKEIEDIINNKA
jgi:hypothetical protein